MSKRACFRVRTVNQRPPCSTHIRLFAFAEKEINIYVGLTAMQRKWYRSVLEKDIDAVNGVYAESICYCLSNIRQGLTGKKEGKTRLMNMVMQVRS